jgi:hypothetical protein
MTIKPKRVKSSITHGGRTIYLTNKELLTAVRESKEQDKMSDELAKMLQLLCAKYAKKGNFVNYCVDSETEALTDSGWKSYDQLTLEDQILSYDIDTRQLTWSRVFDIYINELYDDHMHHMTANGIDALVTPNHKFVSEQRGLIPVEDIQPNENIILNGLPVEQPIEIFTAEYIELISWIITEGTYSTKQEKPSITIIQPIGPKSDRIRTCLQKLNIKCNEHNRKGTHIMFNCYGKLIVKIHQELAPNKILSPGFIIQLTQPQRIQLIATITSINGWIDSRGSVYAHKDKQHIDAILMICALAGITTRVQTNESQPNSLPYLISIYYNSITNIKGSDINFNTTQSDHSQPTVPYKGTIWCPQTEYGNFICKRNGTVYVTGNTYNSDMQGYAMLMLVRTWKSFDEAKSSNPFAFFTQCIHHSFVQYLNQEKRHRDIRDMLITQQGLAASFSFMDDNTDQHFVDDEQDYEFHKNTAKQLQREALAEKSPIIRNELGNAVDVIEFEEEELEENEAEEETASE